MQNILKIKILCYKRIVSSELSKTFEFLEKYLFKNSEFKTIQPRKYSHNNTMQVKDLNFEENNIFISFIRVKI